MHCLLAFDKFKDCLAAREACGLARNVLKEELPRVDVTEAVGPDAEIAGRAGLDRWAERTGITWPKTTGAGASASGWESEALEALGYAH